MEKDSNEILIFAGKAREILYKNDFYTSDRLNDLLEVIKNERGVLSSYISSYSIDYDKKIIQIQFRKAFIKKFDEGKYDSITFYDVIDPCLDKLFKKFKTEIYSYFPLEDVLNFY